MHATAPLKLPPPRRKRLISSCFLFSQPVGIAAQLLTFPKCVLAVLCAIGWRILCARQRSNTRCMMSIEGLKCLPG
ncbi:hypothetical protein M405DRAFT_284658 [Rhizopogon salebrosus TDB-379]|nr:hypothetical protein M405DRAFT_284658 [Rhizopogon salebrosus TDB-379]